MRWKYFRFLAPALALLVGVVPAASTYADSTPLEVVEVRSDGFPRIVARLKGSEDDGLLSDGLAPDGLRVLENAQLQSSAEVMQIRNPAVSTSVALALDVSGSMADEEKLTQAQAAAQRFLQQMRPR